MKLKLLLVGILISLMAFAVSAQDTMELPDGSTVEVLDGWTVEAESSDFAQIRNDDSGLLMTFYVYTEDLMDDNRIDSLEELAEYDYSLYDASEENPFDDRNLEESEVAGLPAVEYAFVFQNVDDDGEREATIIYFISEDNVGFAVEVAAGVGERVRLADAYDILETISFAGGGGGNTGGLGGQRPEDELSEEAELSDGSTINFPSDWEASEGDGDSTIIANDITFFLIYTDGRPSSEDPVEYLQEYYEGFYGDSLRARDIEETEVAGFPASFYDFSQDLDGSVYNIRIFAVINSDGDAMVAQVGTIDGEETDPDLIQAILDSYTPR
jgi:hypothetical protein